jgi:hypothetical protein
MINDPIINYVGEKKAVHLFGSENKIRKTYLYVVIKEPKEKKFYV